MRIIPKKTKVSIEFFKGATLWDIILGFFFLVIAMLVLQSTFPHRGYILGGMFVLCFFLFARFDGDAVYVFLYNMLCHFTSRRRYSKKAVMVTNQTLEKKTKKQKKVKQAKKAKKIKKGQEPPAPDALNEDGQAPSSLARPNATPSETEIPAESGAELSPPAVTLTKKERKLAAKTKKKEAKLAEKTKKKEQKAKVKARKKEDKFLKSKKVSDEEKEPIRARRKAEAAVAYEKMQVAKIAKWDDIKKLYLVNKIEDNFLCYAGNYYGAVLEIPAVEFRFFSAHRRSNAIDRALGSVLRATGTRYATNLIKIERPMVMDEYIASEYEKINALKRSFERGVFNEEELKSRVEVVFERIATLIKQNKNNTILIPFFYLVFFESDKRLLDNVVTSAENQLRQGEMSPIRLNDKELAVFLRYTNQVDFDPREMGDLDAEGLAQYGMPDSVECRYRTTLVNNLVTHNFRVINYPITVGDAWGANLFDIPGTKVVMKFTQMNREKSTKAIDRSISELQSQLEKTSISSRVLELQTHIETLTALLSTLQSDSESLLGVNLYVTAYDLATTRADAMIAPQPPQSSLHMVTGMKKDVKRQYTEAGLRLSDQSFSQLQTFIATQVNGYDPFAQKARGIPSSTVAAVFPWIYANLTDHKGICFGSSTGVPVFLNLFRRDSERVNSNMVIVGKSGGGKSYATKSILTNLAADDSKIFVLDPENEYSELATNLKGKFINVANATTGRLNPFHIITSLSDDEMSDGEERSSYAAHLQFLEEFFQQILPDIPTDALEYLNTLINRVYGLKDIDAYSDLSHIPATQYPTFDDLYDCILEEFQRTKSDYLRTNLRVLMNYIAKFSTGGRNANIWNGPATLSTAENFIVFNFQALLANRNNTVANAQMLLVLKYLDNEIIKNRDYNTKYGAQRKIIIVIDEAHVFIDAKFPVALDFMFQMAKRIRKYNGMQIVITQNIKDFVGNEELARKSTAIINACQYSFIFSLAPNDMHDLCTLYEKAGGINPQEQEEIINAGRGQAFLVTSPTSRSSMQVVTPKIIENIFSNPTFDSVYFAEEQGSKHWESVIGESREIREETYVDPIQTTEDDDSLESLLAELSDSDSGGIQFIDLDEEESLTEPTSTAPQSQAITTPRHLAEEAEAPSPSESSLLADSLQQLGYQALLDQVRRTVHAELAGVGAVAVEQTSVPVMAPPVVATPEASFDDAFDDLFADLEPTPAPAAAPSFDDLFDDLEPTPAPAAAPSFDDLFADLEPTPAPVATPSFDDLFADLEPTPAPVATSSFDDLFADLEPTPAPVATSAPVADDEQLTDDDFDDLFSDLFGDDDDEEAVSDFPMAPASQDSDLFSSFFDVPSPTKEAPALVAPPPAPVPVTYILDPQAITQEITLDQLLSDDLQPEELPEAPNEEMSLSGSSAHHVAQPQDTDLVYTISLDALLELEEDSLVAQT